MASKEFPVAIIGMAVRLPGAESCDEFWKLLIERQDTVSQFPKNRASDVHHTLSTFQSSLLLNEKDPFFTGSFFKSVDKFDADLFSINPKEALFIEPEQRFFLELVWELLEDAGYACKIKGTKTGVYVGNTVNKYKYILTENHPSVSHGNHSPFISSRVSYTLDLSGPAMMVATGCSSSLLAVHLACQGLLSNDCEMAIAGGITLDLLPLSLKTDIWNQLGITGPNVRCRAFDADAKGIAKGEGCGVILLKPLNKAISDGDFVYAVLEASTANQDGHSNGITAPHPIAQANLLCKAWNLAKISPNLIGYFEAHGTGTELGDPIEVSGITTAFKNLGIRPHCKIPMSSVKANIGHLADGGAGIVALIKVVLCLINSKIPPSVNYSEPNPHINWDAAPVYVNTTLLDWEPDSDKSRYASISAFGLLGTNVHTVVREFVDVSLPKNDLSTMIIDEIQILAMAANTQQSLYQFICKIRCYLKTSPDKSIYHLQNICYTVNTGREQNRFSYKAIVYAPDFDKMVCFLGKLIAHFDMEDLAKKDVSGCHGNSGFAAFHKYSSCPTQECHDTVVSFLSGKAVNWLQFYQNHRDVKRIPLIPTYAFDRKRFWPEINKPINMELLQLEHQVRFSNKEALDYENVSNQGDAKHRLAETLNDALGVNYNWQERGNDDLFALGMDSLIFTRVCMKLQSEALFHDNLLISKFHQNPTFNGLKNLLEVKHIDIKSNSHIVNVSDVDVDIAVSNALNEALGMHYDWEILRNKNLFELGMDSLICTHVSMKLQSELNIAIPMAMAELHNYPTFNGLCKIIGGKVKRGNEMPLNQGGIQTDNLYPMSFTQKRLWVTQEMVINHCAYNCTNCLKITGKFHPAAFVLAVNTVLSRHSAFYTVFVDDEEGPMQTYDWDIHHKTEEINLVSYEDKANGVAMNLYVDDYKTPFILKHSPLYRCKLIQLPNNIYYFTMVIHHIIFDGWSHFVFYNELWDTYIQLCEGNAISKEIHVPFFAEIAKMEEHVSHRVNDDLTYWRKKLFKPIPITTLPGDKRRPSVFTYKGRRFTHFIPNNLIESLQKISKNHHTVFTNLLSIVYILLHHYTGDEDLIIGSPIAGRIDDKAKHVIGCFVNTLALRVQIKEGFTFNDVLETVSKSCMEAYDHQSAPFDHLVNMLDLSRDTSTTPLFSVSVCYHNTELQGEHTNPPSDLHVERNLVHNDSAKWDLYFDFLQEEEGLRFTLEYYSDVFTDVYAKGIVDYFAVLLESIVQYPSVSISECQFLVHQMKQDCNYTIMHGNIRKLDSSLPRLLLSSLNSFSRLSSIININGEEVKYECILSKAETFSVFLRKTCQLSEQSRVGLLLHNSIEILASLIACMFSNFVYVPLDYNSPKAKLEFICNDAKVEAVCFNKPYITLANRLQWTCPSLNVLFCVDSDDFLELQEGTYDVTLMDPELWNCVALNAVDDIQGGGWKSSYTGEHMIQEEMSEYADNVLIKLRKHLHIHSKVMEIGCASGITTQKLCPFVSEYIATDLSEFMVKKLQRKLSDQDKYSHVKVVCTCADQIGETFHGQIFDVIIINSVVHCFPGHNYLHKVLAMCEKLLSEEGVLFIGDIMDLDLKGKLITSLKAFKKGHPKQRVKTEWNNELFLSKDYIYHLCKALPTFRAVSCTRKIYTISNELTEFRYDAIFEKSKDKPKMNYPEKRQCKTYALNDISEELQISDHRRELVEEWTSNIDLKDSAYILYTSGTTGVPKGVIISHGALLNYTTWSCEAYKFSRETVIPLYSPLTFDFTITCIFPPLLKGSTIYIFKPFQESYKSISSCKSLTTAKFSPLQLDTILSEATESLTISTYVLGGEELTTSLLTKLKQNKTDHDFLVWNEYGPTEATVGCIIKCFKSEDLPLDCSCLVPIGNPIDNVTVTIVHITNQLLPVPVGGKGRLCIGGKSLCSDFVQGATPKESSKNRNVVSACWGRPGEEMLITDDVVEIMPFHGEIAYLGREKDSNTTKINEIRVDIMEIQDIITNHPMVQNAWVCGFNFKGHTYLGAAVKHMFYCMMENDGHLNIKEILLPYLAQNLSRQFIPAIFVSISESPTTANGKKDVPLLQTLFANEICASVKGESNLVSPLVKSLQKIWQSVLPINHLPQPEEDFFFDLSGDSLQAIHLVRKMRQEGFDISITDIFQNPTIAKLLPLLQKNHGSYEISQLKDSLIDPVIEFRPTPIIQDFISASLKPDHFALSALLQFHNNEINALTLNVALRCVMKKHGSLRSKYKIVEGLVFAEIQELNSDEPNVFETIITKASSSIVDEPEFYQLCTQLEQSHSLADGILVKASVIRYKEGTKVQTYAVLIVHHVAIDIVSWQQVLEDLALTLRRINQQDDDSILHTCFLPFSNYCEALHKEANTGIFLSEMDYWKDLEGQCDDSGLLVNSCNSQGSFRSAVWLCKSIDATYLRSTSSKIGCSDESLLLTLFGRSLSSIHGKAKTAICLESHGRHLKDLDSTDTVGWCTSKFPFVLNTPQQGDIISQIKSTSEAIIKVPNHGLGFGLLKCNNKIKIQYPKIMFVFQGSLDASVKETFDGGKYDFEHIPWIEVMESELQQYKFHRNQDEKLEFNLECIAWIYGGNLKFGCLFDEDILRKDVVESLINKIELDFENLKKIANKMKLINLDIISNFSIAPNCLQTMKEALSFWYILTDKINVWPAEQALQSLLKLKVESVDMVVILCKITADESSVQFFEKSKELKGLSKPGKVVVITNKEMEENNEYLLKKDDEDIIILPHYVNLFYDQTSDLLYNMPFTYNGYMHVGLIIARGICGTLFQCKYKVIIVDADYTLWEGECAEGTVRFDAANIALHKFLLKLKHQGMLLVIISKNSIEDVVRVFQTQEEEMILKQDDFVHIIADWEQKSCNVSIVAKALNLGLDAFVFIDDNPLECEQMIKFHPQVLTVQFPSNIKITLPFLANLWFLDNFSITAESADRTKMYINESLRQAEMKANINETNDVISILSAWDMKLLICKIDVFSLQKNSKLHARAAELLHRTNQFKLNDVNTTLEENDKCWLISLDDCYGSYGIISVITFSGNTICKQWSISCRALGREVEHRIFHEILTEYSEIQLAVNVTGRNIPTLKFLKSLGIQTENLSEWLTFISTEHTTLNYNEGLHSVEVITDVCMYQDRFVNANGEVNKSLSIKYPNDYETTIVSLEHVYHWIQNEWSPAQKQHSLHHNMFPVSPNYEPLTKCDVRTVSNGFDRGQCLKDFWMEILQTTTEPVNTDNFLLAGGSSFSAVFLISKLRRVCKLDINVMDLLNSNDYSSFKEKVLKADTIQNEVHQPTNYNNLSTPQHRMLVMQETAPESTAYVETIAYYTTNKINTTVVFKKLLERHPILASRIDRDSKSLKLMVSINQESVNCNVELELIKTFEDANSYLTKSIPVMKVISSPLALFRLLKAEDKVIFVVHMHHIITDDITLSNIAYDMCDIMNNTTKEHCPFSHKAAIENESIYLKSSQMDLDKDFWHQVFLTLPPEVNLALLPKGEFTWNDTVVYKAKHISKLIPVNVVKEISRFCNSLEVTEFHFYMACVALVLQRYLGVHEPTLAVPVTTRTDLYQTADGLFVNTVLFRLFIDIDSSVKSYIQAVAKSWLQVLIHSQYPFDKVVNVIWKKHRKAVGSFCCVMFNHVMQNRPIKNEIHVVSKHAKMPLSIDMVHNNDNNTTKLMCEWASEIIDDGIAERLVDGVFEIFEKVLRNHNNKIIDVQVLSFSECKLLKLFSQPCQIYEVLNINETFKKHVRNHPDSVAVVCKDKTTTYLQLEAMALLIASELYQHADQSILKKKPVILISEKSEHTIASVLGVWKAGGHFLPVSFSTSNPLKTILECVTPAAILVSHSVYTDIHALGEQYEVPCINVYTLLNNQINFHTKFCDPVINEDDLAYIIKTSGSTGKPKQCKISHKSLGILANAWKIKYELSTSEVNVLQWAPLSFDVFIGDLIRGLMCSAGTLTICPDEFRLDIPYLITLIKQQKVTVAEITPQFAVQLVQNSKCGDLDSLNLLILGSDVLHCHVYKKVKEQLNPNQRLLNSYGMTEATIDSAFFEGNVVPKTRSKTIPIGKPLPGVTLFILDPKSLQPCPVGTIGELYISGPVLASGDVEIIYIQSINCDCLKTNDAAAWLPSGEIELLGRLDSVTKLRGFRISITEIENKIVSNVIGVKDACVVVLGSENVNNGNKFLCAFIVPEPHKVVNLAILRNQLNGKIPYYMLPDIVHTIETMPLSQNGKVDYKALPTLSDVLGEIKDGQEMSTACINTESQVHTTLKELFSEALGTEISQIHLDKTFMEQGGHSLVLLYFATLVKEKTTYDIGIVDIFSYPSINSLAAYIQNSNTAIDNLVETQPKFECNDDIAITGIGLRLPGDVMSLPQLWKVLNEGDDIIRDFPKERINDFLNSLPSSLSSMYMHTDTYQGAFLEAIDQFDCQFFKIAPNEGNVMSPEQRLFLQVATEALAEGRNLSEVKGAKIGVFVGHCDIHYGELNHPDEAIYVAGMMPGMVATRVAYQWDLKGPTVLVDTACSSSLMALKQACESMRNGECEGALVGGVNLVLYPARKGVFGKTSILSPDFHCKPFDKGASGTAVGEGVLCIYAQPLHSALKEKKHIYGIVKGVASNNVGHGNGITAPSSISQQSVIKEALNAAQVRPSDISFIECHGTGTVLGDRIELSALNSIFNHNLPIGSTKSMFGHLDSAAGLLGLFKVLASLMVNKIPPTLHFKTPHSEIQNSLIYVPSATVNWNTNNAGSRLAGLSSFGLTGTNVHAIISEQEINTNEVNAENSTGSTHYPLLILGKSLKQIKKQVSLHQTHIQELILKLGHGHTLLKLCITVAKRLKELKSIGIGHNECRMIITAQNAKQMTMVMKVIMDTENMESLVQLVTLRSDVYFCSPEYKCTNTAYDSFLINGKIDLQLLYPDVVDHDTNLASCVTLALYDESRHWLEQSFKQNMMDSDTEDLICLLNRKASETRELIRMLPLGPTQDLKKTQGRFCSAIIVRLFLSTHLAVYLENGKTVTLKEAFKSTGFLQKYDKLFFIMIRELFENHLVQAIGQDKTIRNLDLLYFKCQDFFNVDPESIANHAVGKYPLWADCFRFPLYCSKNLLDVLMGKTSPLSVIYPQGDLNFMYQFDKLGDLLGDVYYNMYMQVIAMYAKKLSRKCNKVRILEVGAGVGYVTRQLLPKLKEVANVEYWFTDLGKAFVDRAKTVFADYGVMMKFSTFDITKNPIMQGLLGSFDIVISYNVIHTTESILASVVNLSSCLGEGGTLFIIESAMNETWATLAWGILDGWWYFKDYELRPAEPMLEPKQWEIILSKVGFASVYSFPTNTNEREHVEKFLFVCSAKKLHGTTSANQLEWWECDTQNFQPTNKHNEITSEDQVSINTNKEVEVSINESMIYKELENIWSELLGVKYIQPDDDFNFLGGESLLAIQMMHLVCRRIGYQLEIADTFAYPTLRALASFIYEKLLEKNSIVNESITSFISENEATPYDINIPATIESKSHGVLLMFPGQGAQKVGMCKSMRDNASAVEIFNRAKQILGYDILEICTNKESLLTEKLKSTEFVQVALFTSCVAKVEQLKCEKPELMKQVTHVAGLSVGEFVALVYAGVLKFEDALRFIQKRGEAMENDVKRCSTGMISVFGPTLAQLQEFLEIHYPAMTISTYLGDNQHTVAGTEEECQALIQQLKETDVHSSKMEIIDIRKLRVAGAFHSSHMEQAATLLDPALNKIEFSKPLIPVIMNVNGQIVEDPLEIKLMSRKQLIAAVKWKQSIITAYKCGVRNFVEVSPSRVLSSIVKKRISECPDSDVTYINI